MQEELLSRSQFAEQLFDIASKGSCSSCTSVAAALEDTAAVGES